VPRIGAPITLGRFDGSSFNDEFFALAKKAAQKSPFRVFRLGAIIVDRKGRLISSGCCGGEHANSHFKYFYFKRFPGKSMHAEMDAIGKIPSENVLSALRSRPMLDLLRNARIYVYRLTEANAPGNSRPCKDICWPILKKLELRDAVYIYKIDGEPYIAREYF